MIFTNRLQGARYGGLRDVEKRNFDRGIEIAVLQPGVSENRKIEREDDMASHTPTRWLFAAAALAVSQLAHADCARELQALQGELNVIGNQQQLHDTDATAELRRVRALRDTAEVLKRHESEDACKETVAEAREVLESLSRPVALTSEQLIGHEIKNAQGDELGEIKEVIFDLTRGSAAYVLVGFGGFLGFGEELVPVPFSALSMSSDNIVLNISPERLRNAPRYNAETTHGMANRRWHESVYNYFGEQPYWNTAKQARLQRRIDQLNREIANIGAHQKELTARYRDRKSGGEAAQDTDWRADIEQQLDELRTAFMEVETLRAQVARLRDEQRRTAPGTGTMMARSTEERSHQPSKQDRADQAATEAARSGAAGAPQTEVARQSINPDQVTGARRGSDNKETQDSGSKAAASMESTMTDSTRSEGSGRHAAPREDRSEPRESARAMQGDMDDQRGSGRQDGQSDQPDRMTATGVEMKDRHRPSGGDGSAQAKTKSDPQAPRHQTQNNSRSAANAGEQEPATAAQSNKQSSDASPPATERMDKPSGSSQSAARAVPQGDHTADQSTTKGTDLALGRLLTRLDRDKNGQVSEQEANREFVVYKHFGDLDQNRDGALDLAEFAGLRNMAVAIDQSGNLIPQPEDAKPNENWSGPKEMTPAADSPEQSTTAGKPAAN